MRKTCFNMIYELAKKDNRIVYIGSDVGAGTLQQMKEEMPDRFFMEGIQEQNIIGMAAGLALSGRIVYVNTIATFITRRCYEQVVLDLCLHNANVRLLGNGGGLAYAPLGATHEATEDIAIMRAIPNMTILVPADANEMTRLMPQTVDYKGAIYIRFSRGGDPIVTPDKPFVIGKAIPIQFGRDGAIITTGITLGMCIKAAQKLNTCGVGVTVLHVPTIKPLDTDAIIKYAHGIVVTVEEGTKIGGLGSAVADIILQGKSHPHFRMIGLPDVFPNIYGTQESQLKYYGITTNAIVDSFMEIVRGYEGI